MYRTWLTRSVLAITAIISLAGVGTAAAATPTNQLASSSGAHVNQSAPAPGAGTFTGTVKQNGPTLIIHAKDGDHQITVAPGAPVLRNGATTTVDKLKKDDKVTVTLNAQGVATRLDAQNGGTSAGDVLKWLIPLLIVLAIVAVALWWYFGPRRSHRSGVHGRLYHA